MAPLPAAKMGVPNGAAQSTPVWDLHVVEQRVITLAEPGAHDADGDRFADEELLGTLSGLVVIVIRAVVGGLIVVISLGLAADRQRNVAHLTLAVVVLVVRVHDVERIARLHLALKIDIVGVDADHLLDHGGRHVIAQRRLVDALIKPHAAAIVAAAVVLVRSPRHRRRHCGYRRGHICRVGDRCRRLDAIVAGNDHAQRLHVSETDRRGEHPQLLAFLHCALSARAPSTAMTALDLFRACRPARGESSRPSRPFSTMTLCSLQSLPLLAFRQERNVFRNDAGLETYIGVDFALGGVIQSDAGHCARLAFASSGEFAALLAAIADAGKDFIEWQ